MDDPRPVGQLFPRTVTSANVDEIVARGNALWASIYEPHAEKLRNKLGALHPDFIGELSACPRKTDTLSPCTRHRCPAQPLSSSRDARGRAFPRRVDITF